MRDGGYWVERAVSLGFTRAGWIDASRLTFENAEVFRGYCAQNTCGTYNACWTCPPGVGPVKHCIGKIRGYGRALLAQYEEEAPPSGAVGSTANPADAAAPGSRGTAASGRPDANAEHVREANIDRVRVRFKSLMAEFAPGIGAEFPGMLPLGSGGCKICPECAYPRDPCRHPDLMIQSVSAYCIDAGQACGLAGLPCWRDGFVSFTGMFFVY